MQLVSPPHSSYMGLGLDQYSSSCLDLWTNRPGVQLLLFVHLLKRRHLAKRVCTSYWSTLLCGHAGYGQGQNNSSHIFSGSTMSYVRSYLPTIWIPNQARTEKTLASITHHQTFLDPSGIQLRTHGDTWRAALRIIIRFTFRPQCQSLDKSSLKKLSSWICEKDALPIPRECDKPPCHPVPHAVAARGGGTFRFGDHLGGGCPKTFSLYMPGFPSERPQGERFICNLDINL